MTDINKSSFDREVDMLKGTLDRSSIRKLCDHWAYSCEADANLSPLSIAFIGSKQNYGSGLTENLRSMIIEPSVEALESDYSVCKPKQVIWPLESGSSEACLKVLFRSLGLALFGHGRCKSIDDIARNIAKRKSHTTLRIVIEVDCVTEFFYECFELWTKKFNQIEYFGEGKLLLVTYVFELKNSKPENYSEQEKRLVSFLKTHDITQETPSSEQELIDLDFTKNKKIYYSELTELSIDEILRWSSFDIREELLKLNEVHIDPQVLSTRLTDLGIDMKHVDMARCEQLVKSEIITCTRE